MVKKLGLIIQGPLTSRGISGKDAHIKQRNDLKGEDLVTFDCRKNIKETVDKYGILFNSIVVSTWENEIRRTDSWRGVKVITSNNYEYMGETLDGELPNNKFKQFYGILAGIRYLKKYTDVDFVVRTRTDQLVNISNILDSVERYFKAGEYSNEVIFIPRLRRSNKGGCGDFYFAADINTFECFCNSFFKYNNFEFHRSVHNDIFFKYAYVKYKKKLNIPEHGYFPRLYKYNTRLCKHSLKLCKFMLQNVFKPLSYNCYKSIVWRGSQFSSRGLREARKGEVFEKEFLKRKSASDFFQKTRLCFLVVDWLKYDKFRTMCGRKKASFYNHLRFNIAYMFLVPLWYMDRMIYYMKNPGLLIKIIYTSLIDLSG